MMDSYLPLTGMVSSGKSLNTSAISFPLSPQPTYTITSEFEYLDRAYEIHVFPHPKAPGIAHVPPNTDGKSASSTLYPVKSGVSPAKCDKTGLDCLTGHD